MYIYMRVSHKYIIHVCINIWIWICINLKI
jgi:hypothetical protein